MATAPKQQPQPPAADVNDRGGVYHYEDGEWDPRAEIDDLRAEIASLRQGPPAPVGHDIPEHGAGPGTTIRDTWSQYEQELSRRGEWTDPGE